MKNSDRSQRARRLGAALLLLLLPALPLQARGKSEAWARTQYSTAERMREALNELPSAQRSRREYQHVITAYRRVYYGSPTSTKADPSVVAVAELMIEMGRRFNDDKILRSAIGQYKFLRREYPGSRDRVDALFTHRPDLSGRSERPGQGPHRCSRNFSTVIPATTWPVTPAKALARTGAASRPSKNADDSDDDSSAPDALRED